MKNELTHLDLFSGIGGFALAAQRAGFRTICFSEVEPSACEWLQGNFPGVPNLGDIRKPNAFHGIRGVTVLTGGFPCQPFSNSGRKLGKNDPRHLWPAMLGVINEVRPSWVIGENVPTLESLGGLDEVCGDLEAIGYAAQPFNIPAFVAGAPFIGDRLWILAAPTCYGLQGSRECIEPINCETGAFGEADTFIDAFQRHAVPFVCRRHDGVSRNVAQAVLHGYGNAIVPQVVEPFFHWIRQIEQGEIK